MSAFSIRLARPEDAEALPGIEREAATAFAGAPASVSALRATINDGTVSQEHLAMAQLQMRDGSMAHLAARFAARLAAGLAARLAARRGAPFCRAAGAFEPWRECALR